MKKRLIYSFLHSLLVSCLAWIYINSWYSFDIEEGFASKVLIFRHLLTGAVEVPPSDVLLINTAKDLALVQDPGDYGDIPIADRTKLLRLFQLIDSSKAQPRFILCDLLFEAKTTTDSALQLEIDKHRNIVIPYLSGEEGLKDPVFTANKGLVRYYSTGGPLIKLQLLESDSLKNLAVVMDEQLNQRRYTRKSIFTFCNQHLMLNYIIPGYYIRLYQVKEEGKYTMLNLGELLNIGVDPKSFEKFVGNRYLVIGNFDQDMHETPIGKMPGRLILFNTYWSLVYGHHLIRIGWVILWILGFSGISYLAFYGRLPEIPTPKWGIVTPIAKSFLEKYVSYLGLVLLLDLISLVVFGLHVNILAFSLYFSVIHFIRQNRSNEVRS